MRGYRPTVLEAFPIAGHANPGSHVLHEREGAFMRHNIQVRVTPENDSVIRVREVRLRDRLARRILGKSNRYAVLLPGRSVDEIRIIERDGDELTAGLVTSEVGGRA